MHELAVCQALIGQVEHVARQNCARRIVSIVVSIGPLSGVEPQLLRHAYPLVAAGTVAEHAELVLEPAPLRVRCRNCRLETAAVPNRMLCGDCASWEVDVISGEELLLQRVEIETAGDAVH